MDTNQDGDTDDIYGSAMDAAFEPKQKKKSSKKRSSWGSWFMTRRPGTEEILQKQLIALQAGALTPRAPPPSPPPINRVDYDDHGREPVRRRILGL